MRNLAVGLGSIVLLLGSCGERARFWAPDGFVVEEVDARLAPAFDRLGRTGVTASGTVHPEGEEFPGGEFYTSMAYPAEYRGALFEAWDGIVVSRPERCGAAWCTPKAARAFVSGDGLRVTAMETGQDGNLWFGTDEARLYRVAYRPGLVQRMYARSAGEESAIEKIVRQPQPQSSWGRAALLRAKAGMGEAAWKRELMEMALRRAALPGDRVSALLTMERLGPRPGAELLRLLSQDGAVSVRAAAILVASLHTSDRAKAVVATGLSDTDPFVRRRALEGMVRMGLNGENHAAFAPADIVFAELNDRDRFVRVAAREALERYPRETWERLARTERSPVAAPEAFAALARTARSEAELDALFPLELALLRQRGLTAEQKLNAVRALRLTVARRAGGVPEAVKREARAVLGALAGGSDAVLRGEVAGALSELGG